MMSQLRRKVKLGITAACALILLLLGLQLGPPLIRMTGACELAGLLDQQTIGHPFWCFEFWFNRYQTLTGALATLGAGFLAYSAVRRQTAAGRVAERRNELSIVQATLLNFHWCRELADLIDPQSFVAPIKYVDGAVPAAVAAIERGAREFQTCAVGLAADQPLRMEMGALQLSVAIALNKATSIDSCRRAQRIIDPEMAFAEEVSFVQSLLKERPDNTRDLPLQIEAVSRLLEQRAAFLRDEIRRLD